MDAQELIFENHYRAPSLRRVLRLPDATTIAAAAGFIAALIHAVVTREHLAHWWGYGAFFAGLAAAQAVAAVLIAQSPGRRLVIAVVAGNIGMLVLYVLSRALGTTFVGPHAGHPESVTFIDLGAAAAELAQILVLAPTLLGHGPPARLAHAPRWIVAALIAVAAAGFVAPVGPVHTASQIDLLLAVSEEPPVDFHEQHLEELVPPPPPTDEQEAVVEQPAESCTPRLADAIAVPPRGANGEAHAIVYADKGDLYLAAPPDAKPQQLTKDGWECIEGAPVFKDDETISFYADTRIYDVNLRSGKLRTLVEDKGGISAFAWNAAGTSVAYLSWGNDHNGPRLSHFTPATGETRTLRTFTEGGGRCGSMDDETSVRWAPDGRAVLVVATVFDFSQETLFAVNINGKDIIAPRMGTHALWGPGNSVIYREFSDARRWFSLDLDTGHSTRLAMESATHHAAMSPDGRRIAYSNEAEKPALFVYDIVTKSERVLTTGYAAPLWVSSDEIAATKTKACTDEECGGHGEWIGADATAVFDLRGTRVETLMVTSTMAAAVLIDPADSSEPSPTTSSPPANSPTPSVEPTPSVSPTPDASSTSSPEPSPSPTATALG